MLLCRLLNPDVDSLVLGCCLPAGKGTLIGASFSACILCARRAEIIRAGIRYIDQASKVVSMRVADNPLIRQYIFLLVALQESQKVLSSICLPLFGLW